MWLYKVKMSDASVQAGHELWRPGWKSYMQPLHRATTSALLAFPSLWLVCVSAVLQRWYIKHFGCCQRIHQRILVARLAVFQSRNLTNSFQRDLNSRFWLLLKMSAGEHLTWKVVRPQLNRFRVGAWQSRTCRAFSAGFITTHLEVVGIIAWRRISTSRCLYKNNASFIKKRSWIAFCFPRIKTLDGNGENNALMV